MRSPAEFFNNQIDALVHESVGQDVLAREQQRLFIKMRVVQGLIACVLFPLYIFVQPTSGNIETIIFLWCIAPMISVAWLANTGEYEQAHFLSSCMIAPFIGALAFLADGAGKAAFLLWFPVMLFEASLIKKRLNIILTGALVATFTAISFLKPFVNFPIEQLYRPQTLETLSVLSIVFALAYAYSLSFTFANMGQTNDELRSQDDARYQLLAANMTDAILRLEPDGTVRFASQAITGLIDVSTHEALNEGLLTRIHAQDKAAFVNAITQAHEQKEATSASFRLRRGQIISKLSLDDRMVWLSDAINNSPIETSEYIWVEMRAQPLQSEGKQEIVAVLRDITKRKQQEERVAAIQAETARAQQMKTRFLANITHELRTPLNAVIGFSQMLLNEELMQIERAKRVEYAGLINEAGDHLLGIVNTILDMSKLESGKFDFSPDHFDLGEIIHSAQSIVQIKADDAKITMRAIVESNLPEIYADKRACRQIVLNLLSNAVKFSSAGGCVTTHVRREGSKLLISVADNGIGISAEDLPHIGEAFYQAKSNYDRPFEGTGLGLSVVKGLVALHQGEMKISSKMGEGTVFTIYLPLEALNNITPIKSIFTAAPVAEPQRKFA